MRTEYVSLTFLKSCTGFKSSIPTGLPDYHSTTLEKGVKGCIGIFRDDEGGFDVYGEAGQHFWTSEANVIWGRKAVHPGDGTPFEQKPVPVPVAPVTPVPLESDSLIKQLTVSLDPRPAPVKNALTKLPVSKPKGRTRK